MDVVLVIGRILFAVIFIRSGIGHFQAKDMMVGYAQSKGAPAPETTVPLSGAMIILGGLMVALGLWADIGALLLILFLIPTAFIMHAYWKESDAQAAAESSIQFYKDISGLGAAIIIFWLYNQLQDVPASLTDALLGSW